MQFNPYTGRYDQAPLPQQPYYPQTPVYPNTLPSEQVMRVNGLDGANAVRLGPNSSKIVIDETKSNRLFLCMTDGAGFKTVRPMRCEFEDVDPSFKESVPTDRLDALEKKIKELEAMINDKSAAGNRRRNSVDDSNAE